MGGRILVGTSSWVDKSLLDCGRFYPADCTSAEARLRHYASVFPVVQNDAAWYALPSRHVVEDWVERTPPAFVFDIKLFRLFTGHPTPLNAIPKDLRDAVPPPSGKGVYFDKVPSEVRDEILRRYLEAIDPLRAAGKLGIVMVQLAPWVKAGKTWGEHLKLLRERLRGWPMAVEFRNRSWYADASRERTFAWMRENEVCHVVVDEPQVGDRSVPLTPVVTAPTAVLRLHGHNDETWEMAGLASSSERFNYEYTDAELTNVVSIAREMARGAVDVHVMVNVNHEDQGVRAGRRILSLVADIS